MAVVWMYRANIRVSFALAPQGLFCLRYDQSNEFYPTMIETLTLITLCVMYLIFFRPGTRPLLEYPLVINRPGRYGIVLAPRLNLAQPFIESIAERIAVGGDATHSSAARFFVVRDKRVTAQNAEVYLLAIVYRDGMLNFRGKYPPSNDQSTYLDTITSFSDDLLSNFPGRDEYRSAVETAIADAMDGAAREQGIEVGLLADRGECDLAPVDRSS